jgi:hypothetical protein
MNEQASEPEKSASELQDQAIAENAKPEVEKNVECKYCSDPDPARVSHLVCIETQDEEGESHVHVHAPFENRLAMYRMLNAIEEEMAAHKRGDTKKKVEDLL